jgi:hypothetical protein
VKHANHADHSPIVGELRQAARERLTLRIEGCRSAGRAVRCPLLGHVLDIAVVLVNVRLRGTTDTSLLVGAAPPADVKRGPRATASSIPNEGVANRKQIASHKAAPTNR